MAARAVPGDMLVSPKADALIKGARARVAFRVPAGTSRLWVRLNGRSITSRFRRRGSQRLAILSRQSGLRYGRNSLYVLANRSGRRGLVEARSFTLARRVQGLARLKMNPGPVTRVDIRVVAPRLTRGVFHSRQQLTRRLRAIHRPRRVRIRLNGRPVSGAFSRPQPTRWKTKLSATHTLRHGVNRLRVLVVEPETGRYEVLRRRFVVPKGHPLPAAGRDRARPFRLDRMPLDARASRGGNGVRLTYRWKILSKPRGSHPRLRGAGSARPLFDPDRPGRYRVGLQVTDPTNPRATSGAVDVVELTVTPSQLLVPFGFVPDQGAAKPPGIKVGDKFYPNLDESEDDIQWLTLDRSTLQPIKTKNSTIDPANEQQLDALANAVSNGGHGDLVILAQPQTGPPPLEPDRVDQFNSILKLLGVGPIDSLAEKGGQQVVIVGVPYGGDGSGWYSQVFDINEPVLNGFLMPDTVEAAPGVPRFRFQPERIEFDTFNGRNFGGNPENEMKLGRETVTAPPRRGDLPTRGAFHVVAIDPETFEPVDPATDNRLFVTNPLGFGAPANAVDQREAMAAYLTELANRKTLVAVQSIGQVSVTPPADADGGARDAAVSAWRDLTAAMQANGANPHTFYTADGSYAFLGGSELERSEMVDSSSAIQTDPSRDPPVREGGTLQGFASIRSDGLMKPAVADPSDALEFQTYDFVFQAPTPWPHTDAGDPEAGAYRRALAYVSACLPEFEGWGPDLRSAYAGNLNLNYIAAKTDLDKLAYPRPGADPGTCPKSYFSQDDPGFTPDQFGVLKAELGQEFVWLDSIDRLFGAAESALGRSGGKQLVDLKTLAQNLRNQIKPSEATKIFLRIWKYVIELAGAIAAATGDEAAAAFFEFYAATLDLGSELSSDGESGNPLGDEITAKADDLADEAANRLVAAAAGLDSLRQVIISDYGRLKALGSVANSPSWAIDTSTLTARLTQSANQWFSSALLPVPYGVHALHLIDIVKGKATVDNCYITIPAGYDFAKAPLTTQLEFFGKYTRDGFSGQFPTLFVLAVHDLHSTSDYVLDEKIANSIFRPDSQGGFGLQLHRFIWEQYEDGSGAPPTNIAKCN